jgi:hypothetical protein
MSMLPRVDILPQLQGNSGLGFLGHGQALPEIILHEHQAVPQDDLGLPSQNFLRLCDVRLPLAGIIRSVLGHRHCHIWVDQLQSGHVSDLSRFRKKKTLLLYRIQLASFTFSASSSMVNSPAAQVTTI